MQEIAEIIQELHRFRDERDWAQFHNPKDLAIALSVESSELLELFLWKHHDQADKSRIEEELADVLAFAFQLAAKYDLDIKEIILKKIRANELKYPVEKSRGNASKYTEL
ncbi:MAG: nucleotide pyrophosphohydrolase [Leptospirales bacterium]|nr:nucleotide pyrophosphohydrolase [Leptospirales bacterium]